MHPKYAFAVTECAEGYQVASVSQLMAFPTIGVNVGVMGGAASAGDKYYYELKL